MAQPQLIEQPRRKKRTRHQSVLNASVLGTTQKLDAYSLASKLQKREEKKELFYGYLALMMKIGLLAIFGSSFINLGIASHHRVRRQIELSFLLRKEEVMLERLRNRFDKLFTVGGQRRFMREQDQWITPNSVRVIWR